MPTHTPAWQLSEEVLSLSSSHAVPLAFLGRGTSLSRIARASLPALIAGPAHDQVAAHARARATGVVCVQILLSLQAVPSFCSVGANASRGIARARVVAFGRVPCTPLDATGARALWQASVRVQALASLQAVPSAFAGLLHVPLGVAHSTSWHWSLPCTRPGCRQYSCRFGRCRFVCRRCRRCRSSRLPYSVRASAGRRVAGPARCTGRSRTHHWVCSVQVPVWQVSFVYRRCHRCRTSHRPWPGCCMSRSRCCRSRRRGTGHWPCTPPGCRLYRFLPGKCRVACMDSRPHTSSRREATVLSTCRLPDRKFPRRGTDRSQCRPLGFHSRTRGWQCPLLQRLPSSQGDPSAFGETVHRPGRWIAASGVARIQPAHTTPKHLLDLAVGRASVRPRRSSRRRRSRPLRFDRCTNRHHPTQLQPAIATAASALRGPVAELPAPVPHPAPQASVLAVASHGPTEPPPPPVLAPTSRRRRRGPGTRLGGGGGSVGP